VTTIAPEDRTERQRFVIRNVRELLWLGESLSAICPRVRLRPSSLERLLKDCGRHDLWTRLRATEPLCEYRSRALVYTGKLSTQGDSARVRQDQEFLTRRAAHATRVYTVGRFE
jgi:hypothetical protein